MQITVSIIVGVLLSLSTQAQKKPPVFVYFDTRDTLHHGVRIFTDDICDASFSFCFQDFFEKDPWTTDPSYSEIACYRAYLEKCQDHNYRLEDIPPDSIKDRKWLYYTWLGDQKKTKELKKQKKSQTFSIDLVFYSTTPYDIVLVVLPSNNLVRAKPCYGYVE